VNEVLDKLEDLVSEIAEAAKRPGVLGLAGRKIEKRAQSELAGYFKSLKVGDLAEIAKGGVTAEMGKHVAANRLHNIVRKARPSLLLILKSNMIDAIHASRKIDHRIAEADDFSQPFTKQGKTLFDAVEWAEKQAADLVTGLDATTIEQIADSVAQGIEEQLGVAGTGRLIRDVVDEMSVSRAAMIASTEINRAMSAAAVDQLGDLGVEYKRIVLSPDACPICIDNADQDPLPLDEDYDSGDAFPPFHPNCRCAITGARAPQEEV